ncbi:MAG: hypothetical protein WCY12_00920 [Candidatus Omnitrophota bacterium]
MKEHAVVFAVILEFVLVVGCFAGQNQWEKISGIAPGAVKNVLAWNSEPGVILAGTANAIYKSEDNSKSWKMVLTLPSSASAVNKLTFADAEEKMIWAATGNGLYFSADRGNNWKRVYKGRNYLEKQCYAVLNLRDKILLGTAAGLFESRDNARTWQKSAGVKGNSNIVSLVNSEAQPEIIFMAGSEGIFKSNGSANSWERVYIAINKENLPVAEEEPEEPADISRHRGIKYLAISPVDPKYLAAATSAGVIVSRDAGATWGFLTDYGLLEKDIYYLVFSQDNRLVALARSGAFEYRDDRWRELTLELPTTTIYSIVFDRGNNIYAACDAGLFKNSIGPQSRGHINLVQNEYLDNGPKIEDVQKAAIKYAEVQPEKIRKWRKAAAQKAILPKITTSVGRNVTDLWHWETGSSTKNCDDVLMKGNPAIEWDVSMSWDLGELIWNDAQTSIDARSRLMVELRNDILDEVTKLYFERQRVIIELENIAIEDRRKRLDKEIRLRELTANLDALTGGYFSKPINQRR